MSSSANRTSKEARPKDRQLPVRPAAANSAGPSLSVYNVRFPANICEHQSPLFVRQPTPLPGRGGGAVVAPAVDQPSPGSRRAPPRRSPRTKMAASRRPEPGEGVEHAPKHRPLSPVVEPESLSRDRLSHSEVKIKRDAKNRCTHRPTCQCQSKIFSVARIAELLPARRGLHMNCTELGQET